MARGRIQGWVEQGGHTVLTDGRVSTDKVQQSFPLATVTVFNAGTAILSTIFSTEAGAPQSNPFIADADGKWGFWADVARYDVQFSGSGIATPYTLFALNAVLTGQGIIDPGANGYLVRTSLNTSVARNLVGTANRIVVTNGDGQGGNSVFDIGAQVATSGNNLSFFSSTTSAQLATLISDETGSGLLVFGTSPTIGTPTINGGTHIAITSLGIRSSGGGAFDLTLNNTETLTAGRSLTLTVNDVNRVINLGGNLTLANSFTTSGNNALTLTTTGGTNVTLPATGTLATLAGTETFTNKTLTSPRIGTSILDTNGNELATLTATGSAVNEISITNAATGNGPTIAVSGSDANPNLNINAKGTGRVVIKGYPFALDVTTNVVGNVTTGLDTLNSFTIVADTLANNLDFIEFSYCGGFGNNDNDKRITLTVDGQTIFDTGLTDLDGSVGALAQWTIAGDITRISATSVVTTANLLLGQIVVNSTPALVAGATNGLTSGRMITVTVANLDTNPVILLLSAEGTATDDITKTKSMIRVTQR